MRIRVITATVATLTTFGGAEAQQRPDINADYSAIATTLVEHVTRRSESPYDAYYLLASVPGSPAEHEQRVSAVARLTGVATAALEEISDCPSGAPFSLRSCHFRIPTSVLQLGDLEIEGDTAQLGLTMITGNASTPMDVSSAVAIFAQDGGRWSLVRLVVRSTT